MVSNPHSFKTLLRSCWITGACLYTGASLCCSNSSVNVSNEKGKLLRCYKYTINKGDNLIQYFDHNSKDEEGMYVVIFCEFLADEDDKC